MDWSVVASMDGEQDQEAVRKGSWKKYLLWISISVDMYKAMEMQPLALRPLPHSRLKV